MMCKIMLLKRKKKNFLVLKNIFISIANRHVLPFADLIVWQQQKCIKIVTP